MHIVMNFEDVTCLETPDSRHKLERLLAAQVGVLSVEIEDRRISVTFRAEATDRDPQDIAMLMLCVERTGWAAGRLKPLYDGHLPTAGSAGTIKAPPIHRGRRPR